MAEGEVADPLGAIEIEPEKTYGEKFAEALPVAGAAIKTFDSGTKAFEDGNFQFAEIRNVAAEGGNFVQSCLDVKEIATDPIGWLVGEGLDFLVSVCGPLQDAIHFVSGDGEELSRAADNFNSIAEGLEEFGKLFADQAETALSGWEGQAANTAADKLGQFAGGVGGVAAQAGNIAQLLQISSMVMTVVEEFVKGLLTELITWLVMIWVPALASAIVTCGASTAAAGAATTVRVTQAGGRATRQIGKLQQILDRIREILADLKTFVTDVRGVAGRALDARRVETAARGAVGERLHDGFGRSVLRKVGQTSADQVKLTKIPEHFDGVSKAVEYGGVGEQSTTEETKQDLDF
ncbi:WXG100 family type VII secretion target [Amycolatopsis granulosa]|uniref:WXG100 family type VII secretion target n=1 Tax=Amycolatopsis granulosa TaxID=185684 RepID=UPI00142313D2|nr:WXG100 family type VII secretion target [Amycolatopsis granulosa]NIH85687.1 uncharacterized membrane protein YtjA (UPF0391 family) [Amycolatopsis granulosa]